MSDEIPYITHPKRLELVRTISLQSERDNLNAGSFNDTVKIFDNGAAIEELARTHPDFDSEKGRIFPGPEEDEEMLYRAEDENELAAIVTVAYQWRKFAELVAGGNESAAADHYPELKHGITQLLSWHPDEDPETGHVRHRTPEEDAERELVKAVIDDLYSASTEVPAVNFNYYPHPDATDILILEVWDDEGENHLETKHIRLSIVDTPTEN